MKTHPSRRKHGFTLVELLVVIAIIAVLAGAGFAAGNAAIQKAKKVTALATCTGLEQAVNAFFTEYGAMPKETNNADINIDTGTDKAFLNTLLGYTETAPVLNSKAIKFLNVKEGKKKGNAGINGLITSGSGSSVSASGLYDPWGGSFKVRLDGDYDESISVQPKGSASSATLNGRRVAAWSDGADGATGTGKASDDVKTW